MYLQLAGPSPLDTAENPLAPGAKPYSYDAFYLGQSQDIILPDALFPANVQGYGAALKSIEKLFKTYVDGLPTPAQKVQTAGLGVDPVTLYKTAQAVGAALKALSVVARGIQVTAARNQITQLYNNNTYNVQNLNSLSARQVADQITRLDGAITDTPRFQFGRKMALSRFRLIYQQRFDQVTGGGGIGNLPGWVLPAALGLGAFLIFRGRR